MGGGGGAFVRFFIFLVAAILTFSCDSLYIKEWYDAVFEEKNGSGTCDITLYCFLNPVGVGVIGEGSGSEDDPVLIGITYPFGTSVPASDADIVVIHTGASVEPNGHWAGEGGAFVRSYTVTAKDETQKRYKVRATEAESTGTSSGGVIGAFQFSATNGLLEGHVNTQSGAVAGVFSDPDIGLYPFTYTLENNTDLFEIAVEDDTALLKIKNPLEAKSPWIVRVKVTDNAGSFYTGPVQFVVNPAGTVRPITADFKFSRAPGGLWIHSIGGEIAGTFSPPSDGSGTAPFSYELVTGDGLNDADNGSFEISSNGSALSIKGDAVLLAEQNPYNIYVKLTDSLGETRCRAFEFNIGVGRIMLTNHPSGTHPYTARLYAGSLDARTFTEPDAPPISEGEAVARSTIADMVVHGTAAPEEGEDKIYALLLTDADGGYVGYFNGVTFEDGVATVYWPELWHTFTDAAKFSAFMAAPDSTTNNGLPYRIALNGINMKTELSAGGTAELYSRLRPDFSYSIDFRGCTGDTFISVASHLNAAQLREVYLGGTLKTIGEYAFDGCVNMTNTSLPPAVETIGDYAFRGCRALPDISFPKTIETIGVYAFADCTGITAVDLSGSALETVGQYAFYSAAYSGNSYPSKIASVDFSDCESLTLVGDYAFRDCRALAGVDFSGCGELAAIGNGAFYDDTNLATICFSGCDELVTIGNEAFRNCDKVQTVDFSDCFKLKTICDGAFYDCNALVSVDMSNTKLETIGNNAFGFYYWYTNGNLTTVDLSAVKTTLKTIGGSAFAYCSKLATVNLSSCEKLESIGGSAFRNCSQFTEAVDLTKSKTTLTTIGDYAFASSGIASITLPGCTALTSVGGYAFASSAVVTADLTGCTALTTVGGYAFASTSALGSADLTGCTALTSLGSYAFAYSAVVTADLTACSALPAIQIYTFASCSNLTTVTLTGCTSLTIINAYAFSGSTALATVTLTGTKIATIGDHAFYGCTALKNLLRSSGSYNSLDQIKTTLTTIGTYAFSTSGIPAAELGVCTALTTINSYAFDYCGSLTSIQLPSSLTLVADHAFEHCSVLATINSKIINPSATIFSGAYTFSGIAANFTLLVPSGQVSTYETFWASKTNWQQPGSVTGP